MTLTREQTIEPLEAEWKASAAFLRSLSEADMAKPTRCEGWTVGDVAAHIAGTVTDIAGGTIGATNGYTQVQERAGQSPARLADDMEHGIEIALKLVRALDDHLWAQPSPFPGLTFRQGVEALFVESYVHEDDIRDALGMPPRADGDTALEISLHHIAEEMGKRGWNQRTLSLDGVQPIAIGFGGEPITGNPRTFLLAATGRIPASAVGLDEKVNIYRG